VRIVLVTGRRYKTAKAVADDLGFAVPLVLHNGALLDVVAEDVSKEGAVAFLEARWGLTAAETMAVGDNWNDQGMLVRAGRGLVMGNADPGMRRLGLPVLPTNDEDGVAVAIETHLLGLPLR
jgi:hydroxymethylpyrimidine pyrophosphatase-like HAD family hydrolase